MCHFPLPADIQQHLDDKTGLKDVAAYFRDMWVEEIAKGERRLRIGIDPMMRRWTWHNIGLQAFEQYPQVFL
jgi:hypothetical protein